MLRVLICGLGGGASIGAGSGAGGAGRVKGAALGGREPCAEGRVARLELGPLPREPRAGRRQHLRGKKQVAVFSNKTSSFAACGNEPGGTGGDGR